LPGGYRELRDIHWTPPTPSTSIFIRGWERRGDRSWGRMRKEMGKKGL